MKISSTLFLLNIWKSWFQFPLWVALCNVDILCTQFNMVISVRCVYAYSAFVCINHSIVTTLLSSSCHNIYPLNAFRSMIWIRMAKWVHLWRNVRYTIFCLHRILCQYSFALLRNLNISFRRSFCLPCFLFSRTLLYEYGWCFHW